LQDEIHKDQPDFLMLNLNTKSWQEEGKKIGHCIEHKKSKLKPQCGSNGGTVSIMLW
jgi:hypothetical protein